MLDDREKLELSVALILLKDFRCKDQFDAKIFKDVHELASKLGVSKEFEANLSKLPIMKITEMNP